MRQDRNQFENNLFLYGADLEQWPAEIKSDSMQMLKQAPDLQDLLDEHQRFESTLKERRYEAPSSDLVERIIRASWARSGELTLSAKDILMEALGWLGLGKPRAAVVTLLAVFMVGLTIGLMVPTRAGGDRTMESTLRHHLNYYGEML